MINFLAILLQTEREDTEVAHLGEVPGNTDAVHPCDGLRHGRHYAGKAILCFRSYLSQNAGDCAVRHHRAPTREFVRQQLMLLSETITRRVYLIHDSALMFNIDFLAYDLISIKTGVEAPNMNSIMERFFNTVRREALDNFLLIGRSQIERSWRNTLPSTTASDHIRGFNNKSRILVNQRK